MTYFNFELLNMVVPTPMQDRLMKHTSALQNVIFANDETHHTDIYAF